VLSSQDQDYAVKAISERDKALRTIAERDDTIAFVTALAYAWAPFKDDGGTHWAGCHLVHADCFVYAIRAAMEGTP